MVEIVPEPQEYSNERNENKRMEMQIELDLICVFCSFGAANHRNSVWENVQ